MLKQRIFTALILIPLTVLLLFYLPPRFFCILTAFIALGAAWEWSHLMEMKSVIWRLLYLVVMAFVFFNLLFIPMPIIFVGAFIWWLLATVLVIFYPRLSAWWGKGIIWRGFMGF